MEIVPSMDWISSTYGGRPERQNNRSQAPENASPIQVFPPEILEDIFLSIPGYFELHQSRQTAPWNLGSVCQSWRKVLCSSQRLWTRIRVSFHSLGYAEREEKKSRLISRRLSYFLQRSGNLPLSMEFSKRSRHDNFASRTWKHFFRLLLAERHRWVGHINADWITTSRLRLAPIDALSSYQYRFPNVTAVSFPHGTFNSLLSKSQLEFPSLRKVIVGEIETYLTAYWGRYPLTLQHIVAFLKRHEEHVDSLELRMERKDQFSRFDCGAFATFLAEWAAVVDKPALKSLTLEVPPHSSPQRLMSGWGYEGPPTLSTIQRLRIDGQPSVIVALLSWLDIPSLRELQLRVARSGGWAFNRWSDNEWDGLHPVLFAFLDRPNIKASLESLELRTFFDYRRAKFDRGFLERIGPLPELCKLSLLPIPSFNCDKALPSIEFTDGQASITPRSLGLDTLFPRLKEILVRRY
ncbi:hypothetical protein CC2G_002970 [Coprinopsis cinerea AmutBmut pab1-1]|nr:hypothetical protein CC2G_002970 [Coprinopsis cinerea AmutBmut pab1-1]